ncbi:restriction endonuclease subunit S [Thioalkalivibrio sp. ALMg13-2]|uniref:restriction endonuclease subunit S n=1 Tax=Thioalkalivibrio sp. ALMg13-2 TaxID=1158167 RepID=UPI00037D8582|nr:restriction endonuclease subunit S [Thioalkalivibrio sp. ALMg13-2]
MSFPRYPEYKDSGIEWLGEVPAHWKVKRLRYVAELNPSKSEIRSLPEETRVSFIPMEAVGDDGSLVRGQTRALHHVIDGYTYVREGDVAVAKITPCFENGKAAMMRGLTNGVGLGTTELTVLRPRGPVTTSAYLFRIVTSEPFRWLGESHMYGAGGQKRVPDDFLRDFSIAWPSREEQAEISAFLDHETGKIDALIEEQRRLIELLKEKRQAVISHAVTKGLEPNVAMKDSGVEWLGEVPAHWEVHRLKYVSPEITVGIVVEPSKYYVDEGVPALRSVNVKPGGVSRDNLVFISLESNDLHSKSKIYSGDLVAVRSGQPGTTGVVPEDLDGCNCIDLIIIRKPDRGSEWFLSWYLGSDSAIRQFSEGSGGAIQQHFNIGTASNLLIAWPPFDEQFRIVQFIEREATRLDRLIDEAEQAMSLLSERKSALISAAVTGKIDVRGWSVGAESEEPELAMVAEESAGYSTQGGAA